MFTSRIRCSVWILLWMLVMGSLVLAMACGGSSDDEAVPTSEPAPVVTTAPAPAATPTPIPQAPTDVPTLAPTDAPTSAPAPTAAPAATATPAPPSEVEITHYSGTDTVPVNPETLVVADMAAMLSLHDLGVEGVAGLLGLGVPVPDKYEQALNNPDFEELGSVWEPDYEAINALEPA